MSIDATLPGSSDRETTEGSKQSQFPATLCSGLGSTDGLQIENESEQTLC